MKYSGRRIAHAASEEPGIGEDNDDNTEGDVTEANNDTEQPEGSAVDSEMAGDGAYEADNQAGSEENEDDE